MGTEIGGWRPTPRGGGHVVGQLVRREVRGVIIGAIPPSAPGVDLDTLPLPVEADLTRTDADIESPMEIPPGDRIPYALHWATRIGTDRGGRPGGQFPGRRGKRGGLRGLLPSGSVPEAGDRSCQGSADRPRSGTIAPLRHSSRPPTATLRRARTHRGHTASGVLPGLYLWDEPRGPGR